MLPSNKRRKHRFGTKIFMVAGITMLVFVPVAISRSQRDTVPNRAAIGELSASTEAKAVAGENIQSKSLRQFSGKQFQELYESLAMPNTEHLHAEPIITGNEQADQRIQQIAENRGYTLRSVPVLPIMKTNTPGLSDDDLLQPKAYDDWRKLEKAAQKANIPLKFNSGYRSVEWQRRYFLQQLSARGATIPAIARGHADRIIESVLEVVAPPGYSRHHTGYAIDLICDDGSGRPFEFTKCFTWLSANNYASAKKFGFIPSYPDKTDKQGPEPEPWEYVWVGTDATYQ